MGRGKHGKWGRGFIAAAAEGDVDEVKRCLASESHMHDADHWKVRALIAAASGGHLEVATILIGAGTDVNKANAAGETPVSASARCERIDLLKLLVKCGADLTGSLALCLVACVRTSCFELMHILERQYSVDMSLFSDSHLCLTAAEHGHLDMLEYLIRRGADCRTCNGGRTALTAAVDRGDLAMVKVLADRGALRNIGQEFDKDTRKLAKAEARRCCRKAAERGDLTLVRVLAERGLVAPCCEAVERGAVGMLRMLLECGGDVFTGDPLSTAVRKGHISMVSLLLINGATASPGSSPTSPDQWQGCPLREAVALGNTLLVKLLIEHGATPTSYYLLVAVEVGHVGVLRALVAAGVDVNEEAEGCCQAAVTRGDIVMMQALVECGTDLRKGGALCVIAVRRGNRDMLLWLLTHGADPNLPERGLIGKTAAQVAAEEGSHLLVDLLVHGVDPDSVDRNGNTLCLVAARAGRVDTLRNVLMM
eukprot:Hpha_TRINITY_DN15295_c1_g1::TRINITY_DN15295_c1_g1_i3::g.68414::m.68414